MLVGVVDVHVLSYDDDRYLIRRNFGEWGVGGRGSHASARACVCYGKSRIEAGVASHTLALGS